jgi:hypothetical protein
VRILSLFHPLIVKLKPPSAHDQAHMDKLTPASTESRLRHHRALDIDSESSQVSYSWECLSDGTTRRRRGGPTPTLTTFSCPMTTAGFPPTWRMSRWRPPRKVWPTFQIGESSFVDSSDQAIPLDPSNPMKRERQARGTSRRRRCRKRVECGSRPPGRTQCCLLESDDHQSHKQLHVARAEWGRLLSR